MRSESNILFVAVSKIYPKLYFINLIRAALGVCLAIWREREVGKKGKNGKKSQRLGMSLPKAQNILFYLNCPSRERYWFAWDELPGAMEDRAAWLAQLLARSPDCRAEMSKYVAYFGYEKFILTTVSKGTERRFLQLIDVKTSTVLHFNVIAPLTAVV